MMRTRTWACGLVFFAAVFMAVPASGAAQTTQTDKNVIWQIGEFDQTSREFGHNFDPGREDFKPIFTIGQSKTADWPARQFTSANATGGTHGPPYTILFSLSKPPEGRYQFTVSVLLVNPSVPDLLVEINGRKGLFYFDRKISYYPGDDRVDSPIYGADQLEIHLPAGFLKAGQNRLVLTAVEDRENPGASASLIYDALRLSKAPSGRVEPSGTVKPTVFFKQKGNQTYEVATLTVTSEEKLSSGQVDLSVGREHFRAALSAADDFGQQRLEFEVPAFSGPTRASLAIHANGKTSSSSVLMNPERKWSIYFVPHAHLDIGYTDYQPKVAELQSRNIDKLLEFFPKHPEMRFSLDGSWVAQNYFATRKEAARKQFLELVHEGKIGVPAQYANLLTGYASLEELIRSLSYAHSLHRSEGIPFDYANITDVPSVTWSYASVLKAAGIKYFAEATNSDRGPIVLYGKWNEKSPFWREGPDGGKVLMANTRQYSQLWFVCDLPPQVGNCRQGLPAYLQQFAAPDYKPDAVLMYGSQLENTDARLSEPDFVSKWNAEYAYPKFLLSTFPDYFHYIEQRYGTQLATVTGDGGPYWEDGVASDAANTAIDRNSQSRALSAEKLSTVSQYLNPTLGVPRPLLDRIWTNLLLYAEHTWDSWDSVYRPDSKESVGQLATKDQYATEGQQAVGALIKQSLSQIGDQVYMPSSSLVVFNSLSWSRSGLVELDLDYGTTLTEYPEKTPVPVEILRAGAGYKHVRFLATDVPAMGFKCYSLEKQPENHESTSPASQETHEQPSDSIENAYYRIQLDVSTGGVKSIFDKQLNRELVDTASPYRFNQYVYVEGGGKPQSQVVYMRKSLPIAQLKVTPSFGGQIVGLRRAPFGQILIVEAKDIHTPSVRSEIVLYDGEKKIEFVNHVVKDAVRDKEGVYFAFPVAAPKPALSYEIQNGWVDPSKDMMKGAGLEWFTVGHWVKASGDGWDIAIVPVDAPLVTFGDINRGVWPEVYAGKTSTIFSYVFNNYWHTNYRAEQGGETAFRYVMKSGPSLDPEELSRFGRAAMTPLEAGEVVDQDKAGNPDRPLKPGPVSFLQVDAPDVVVENWKSAEDGDGTILRLLETGGRESKVQIQFPLLTIQKAWLCNAVEENQKEIPVSGSRLQVSLRPHQIATVRILGESGRLR